jgi:hypothetical protein
MGHGPEVYFMNGMSGLGEIGWIRGLDRNWGIAPGMVQSGRGLPANQRSSGAGWAV